ncbi:amino acid adenylation domain-containing protein [Curtobacterium flaccumfaciens]|uniref:amino acid adenylation domain-containing protein n=1 Tax=Curtobacterium flaccumfaciens TaxID=2035 RepID=UPI001600DEFD|nr:amino acid adenylation domain-containing protein [Curtobacterium flaccumfaciens]MBB1195619.1 amino acid adenylation domain-containing protein [Curtobacterium flaccumfaciens]
MTSIVEAIDRVADADPDRTAIAGQGDSYTYSELRATSRAVAETLRSLVPPGSVIALDLLKSPSAILVMLACYRAGLPYVPLDAKTPAARRDFQIEDSGCALVVCDSQQADPTTGMQLRVTLEELISTTSSDHLNSAVAVAPNAEDIAYVLYTSGSTGQPKGVLITRGNMEAFVDWAQEYTDMRPDDRVAVHAPLSFDLPVLDVWVGLTSGSTVMPVDQSITVFPQAFYEFLRDKRITILYAVPSALIGLLRKSELRKKSLSSLRLLLYAGEEFHPRPLSDLMQAVPNAEVHNLYGPIETNVMTALRVLPLHLGRDRIPLGHPITNAHVLIRTEGGEIVTTTGRVGEILLTGPSLCRGYLNRPGLTAKSRLDLPIDGVTHTFHRTGDLGSWGSDGLLCFHGRASGFVKTRGYRVEPGEVEAALSRLEGVAEAAVIAVPDEQYGALLHAFVIPESGQRELLPNTILSWCRDELPSYMVPSGIRIVSALPRTGTGKIARQALLAATDSKISLVGSELEEHDGQPGSIL